MSAELLILAVQEADVVYGDKVVFEDLSFNIRENEKICLVGKNGAGKTTLMRLITGALQPDKGERWELPGLRIGYLEQDLKPEPGVTVAQYVFSKLPKEKQSDEYSYMLNMVIAPLELDSEARLVTLSGGQLRRAALAGALAEEPDLLLLDEPTNHLDLQAIEWLEGYLAGYRGALLCVSHDKTFLSKISNSTFWLDRGKLKTCPRGFAHFDDWSGELLAQEARELHNREKALAEELEWASRGVKARRKRNQRRLEEMKKERERLKADKSLYNRAVKKISYEVDKDLDLPSNISADFVRTGKSYFDETGAEKKIFDAFTLRIVKGDRIGVLGRNGSGKSTFLKLLTGEITPDKGTIKRAKNAQIAYFDQHRTALKANETIKKTLVGEGGDFIKVGGKMRHVCGYLKDFMFDPKQVETEVSALSGGQQNRLALAKTLANPGNFLILDEPTNDLDADTLDMLEEILSAYKGTLVVVSHDRDFLTQTVSKLLIFEERKDPEIYIGTYEDYAKAKSAEAKHLKSVKKQAPEKKTAAEPVKADIKKDSAVKKQKKVSFKVKYEFENLPTKIEGLKSDIEKTEKYLSDPKAYEEDPEKFNEIAAAFDEKKAELEIAEFRYLELDEMINGEGEAT